MDKNRKLRRFHVGIGGWTFEPWRGVFYPKGLAQAKELTYAAELLSSIEINGTYYGCARKKSARFFNEVRPMRGLLVAA